MGFMAIINLVVIVILGKWAFKLLDDYSAQRKAGKNPVFVAESIPGLPPTECWHVAADELEPSTQGPISEFTDDVVEAVTTGRLDAFAWQGPPAFRWEEGGLLLGLQYWVNGLPRCCESSKML